MLIGRVQRRLQRPAAPPASLRDFEITQLTTSGNAVTPAISPDGKYVAYVQQEGNGSSLWIRQIATSSNVRVVASQRPAFRLIVAHGDAPTEASWISFDSRPDQGRRSCRSSGACRFSAGRQGDSWRTSASPIGWSPDGRQMAFIRVDAAAGSVALVIADAEGGRARVLSTRRFPALFVSTFRWRRQALRPAWSPDGRTIAVFAGDGRTPDASRFRRRGHGR